MAKKTAKVRGGGAARGTKKAPQVKAKSGKSSRTSRRASGGTSRKPSGPRSVPLPGLEQVRNARLDELCESLGETRDKMADLRTDETADMNSALKEMRTKGLTSYRHAGIEFARVPGEEKLRVRRTTKTEATAENQDDGDTIAATDVDDDAIGGDDVLDADQEDLDE